MSTPEDRAWTLDEGASVDPLAEGTGGGTSPKIEDVPPVSMGPETAGDGVLEQLVKLEVDRQVERVIGERVDRAARELLGVWIRNAEAMEQTNEEPNALLDFTGHLPTDFSVQRHGPEAVQITLYRGEGQTNIYLPRTLVRDLVPGMVDAL